MLKKKQKEKTPQKGPKKSRKKYYIGGGILFVVLIILWGFMPLTGTIHLGICRTYAELQMRYPGTFAILDAEVFQNSQRIHYSYVGPYGNKTARFIDCRFKMGPEGMSTELVRIDIDRVQEPEEKVKSFALTVDAVVAAKPDLIIGFPPGDDLYSLKRDY